MLSQKFFNSPSLIFNFILDRSKLLNINFTKKKLKGIAYNI